MNTPDRPGLLDRLDRAGRLLENTLLSLILILMLGVAIWQIAARNLFDSGMVWADEFLRLTVLWVALLGSIAAARDYRHLRIDLLSRFLPVSVTRWTDFVVDCVTVAICLVLAWYSYLFVAESREYEDLAFGTQPLWWFQIILPIGFALMAFRFAVWALRRLSGRNLDYAATTNETGAAGTDQ